MAHRTKLALLVLLPLIGPGCKGDKPKADQPEQVKPVKRDTPKKADPGAAEKARSDAAPAARADAASAAAPRKLALPDHKLRAATPAAAKRFFRRWFKAAYPAGAAPMALKVTLLEKGPAGLTPIVVVATSSKKEKCKEAVEPKHADDCRYITQARLYLATFVKKGKRLELAAYLAKEVSFAVDQVDLQAKLVDRGDWNSNGDEEILLQVESTAEVIPAHGTRNTSGYHLLELGAKVIFDRVEVDGGTTPLGTTLDVEESTTSTCRVVCKGKACALEVKKTTHCPTDKSMSGPCTEKEEIERRAWSAKHGRWQVYSGMKADAYVLVAATRPLDAAKKTPLQAEPLKAATAGWLALTPGYPRIVESDDFAGLRPGYQLVLLGICKHSKYVRLLYKKMPRRVRRTIKPYSRGILLKKQRLACPALAGGK